jgi:hypothetical protein
MSMEIPEIPPGKNGRFWLIFMEQAMIFPG